MASRDDLEINLNETIAAAVKAKIDASVMEALAGDAVIAGFVTAALTEPVQVDRFDRGKRPTYLEHVLKKAIQEATKEVVGKVIDQEKPKILAEVEKAIGRKTKAIAKATVDQMTERAQWRYGLDVDVTFTDRD